MGFTFASITSSSHRKQNLSYGCYQCRFFVVGKNTYVEKAFLVSKHFALVSYCFSKNVCMMSSLVVSDSVPPYGLQPIQLSCAWDSPGKNTGVGCHALLQGIFPTHGLNLGFLHCRQILYHLSHQEAQRCHSVSDSRSSPVWPVAQNKMTPVETLLGNYLLCIVTMAWTVF